MCNQCNDYRRVHTDPENRYAWVVVQDGRHVLAYSNEIQAIKAARILGEECTVIKVLRDDITWK